MINPHSNCSGARGLIDACMHKALAALFLAIPLLSQTAIGQTISTERPNVLFLICDDLNCDIGCYGHSQVATPHMDAFAKRGVRFDRAYCQFPLCGPSRASFMTGLYPDQTLIHRNAIDLRERLPRVVTMSQMFRNAGYFATRIGKIYHYNVPKNIGTGGHDDPDSWDHTINPYGRDKLDEAKIFTLRPGSYGGTLSWLSADGEDREQTDGMSADAAIQLLEQYGRTKQPFYLAVGLFRPHTPYVAPHKYFNRYPAASIRVPENPPGYLDTLPKPAVASITRKKEQVNLPDETAREAIRAYYASITFADAQLGRILKALDESKLTENTIVLFTSDHGYHMGEHGHYQKSTLFENAARVPLIIAGPGVTAVGQTAADPVEMTDFYPTLAELAGLRAPSHAQGKSLAPTLRDAKVSVREAALTQYATGYSIRTSRYRYTEWGADGEDGIELYDHQNDPAEMTNLAGANAAGTQALSNLLRTRVVQARRKPQGLVQRKATP